MSTLSGPSRARILAVAVTVVCAGVVAAIWLGGDDADDSGIETGETAITETTQPADDTGTTATTTQQEDDQPGAVPAIALEPVVDVEQPTAVADPPGVGSILVATLDGRILAADLDSGERQVVLDLTDVVSVGGERGLLGLAIDPDGDRLYVDYTDANGDTVIRSWAMDGDRPVGAEADGVVHLELDQPSSNHNGGHLAFGPDGTLWIGTGDGGGAGDPDDNAQDPSTLLGKMLRVEPDPVGGVTAADNPDWGGRPEIWGIGLRNPWRYSFDRETGRLWIADVGQNSTEEVSVIDPDAPMPNFGWNIVEGDEPFAGEPDPSFVAPALTYGHDQGCSITGGHVYRGEGVPSLRGWYLFGDFCGGWVRAVPADDPGAAPVELASDLGSVLSFAELADGELLVLTESTISRIVPA